ncbi:hypothetical protein CEXT_745301 [Caerostris extrusa]|uniref:Uncharacterized protein n=1 Tax=Caerostris extrusa TaxID=172846 RepID=A0AAV4V9K0_CAEEX|nr:hypothetical protein CEXT_745301 [Caerostris extrusa]
MKINQKFLTTPRYLRNTLQTTSFPSPKKPSFRLAWSIPTLPRYHLKPKARLFHTRRLLTILLRSIPTPRPPQISDTSPAAIFSPIQKVPAENNRWQCTSTPTPKSCSSPSLGAGGVRS